MASSSAHDANKPFLSPVGSEDEERSACTELDPSGFFIRHPPKPHLLQTFITPEEMLFQTIHMGAAVVDLDQYRIIVDGLVEHPFSISLPSLRQLPATTITSFHECYGSPLKPPIENVWRIGNVMWTGVPLRLILEVAKPLPEAAFVWSDGLDFGEFGGVKADRYQKDLPLQKALSGEVLVAYAMNGEPLTRKRGGPARLVVPGWFGTNSTKWLCRLSLQAGRAMGNFTTRFYNEEDPDGADGGTRPVWMVEPNSMIVKPGPDAAQLGPRVEVGGWAWSCEGIQSVDVVVDEGVGIESDLESRVNFSWQWFKATLDLAPGSHTIASRATSKNGKRQPLSGRRNHVHTIHLEIL